MKHVIKPAFTLFIIAAVTTVLLSLAHTLTLEPIANQAKKTQEKMMREVLTQATGFREIQIEKTGSIVRVFEGVNGNELVGYIVELDPRGYGGAINMMVGISTQDDKVTGMRVLRHNETAGLGALIVKKDFYNQFKDKKLTPLKVVKTSPKDDEVDAITSATITTKAVTGAVNEAIAWYNGGGRK